MGHHLCGGRCTVTRYVLDTDIFSLYLTGHPAVGSRLRSVPVAERAVSAVTVAELAQGWLAQVSRHSAEGGPALWHAYGRLAQLPLELAGIAILPYAAEEEARFVAWRRAGIRIGTNDLRIAAVAVCAGGMVITRNEADFGRVPGLATQDWSV